MRSLPILLILLVPLAFSGCATSGFLAAGHLTEVQLSAPNYRIVAVDVSGEAEAAYILGLSASLGPEMRTIALARVSGTGQLYREALADLWRNFEQQHGPVTHRRLALVNLRFDSEALNLLVYTRPRIYVRADVVEFTP
jgi:ABC-type transporter Mla MlaB component